MKFSGKTDALFIALIAATLLMKLTTLRSEPPLNGTVVPTRLQAMLAEEGLAATFQPESSLGPIVFASQAGCRLWASEYTPYGTFLTDFQNEAKGWGSLMFAYGGQLYSRPPKIAPLMRHYLSREFVRAGFRASRFPIIGIAASRECELELMTWNRVAEVDW